MLGIKREVNDSDLIDTSPRTIRMDDAKKSAFFVM